MKLEGLQVDPQAEVLVLALAAPRVPAESHRAQGWQRQQGCDVEHRQVVPAHIQHLEVLVFRKSVRMDLWESGIVGHPQHNQAGQGPERPVLDPGQGVEREVQVGQFTQIPKRGFGDLRQGVVAAVQIHQVREVVEREGRQLHDAIVGDDELPRGQRQVDREGGQVLPSALNHQLVIAHAPVRAAGGDDRGRGDPKGQEQNN